MQPCALRDELSLDPRAISLAALRYATIAAIVTSYLGTQGVEVGARQLVGRTPTSEMEETEHSRDIDVQRDPSDPVLRVPEERTPLPDVDRALPVLELIAATVSRKRPRFNVAALKSLQESGNGRWKIRDVQETLDWLEPQSATEVVGALRGSGMLRYEPLANRYTMPADARVAAAVMAALAAGVDRRRMIRVINKAMSFAQAAGAGDDILVSQFRSAVAVLRSDLEELRMLLDDYSDRALREAAEVIGFHVEDMRSLLGEHEELMFRHRGEPDFLRTEREALGLVADLGGLCATVVGSVSERADERMRSRALVDRSDLRDFLLDASRDELATVVDDCCVLSPQPPWLPAEELFAALEDAVAHHATPPPPLPPPVKLEREEPRMEPTATERMLEELAGLDQAVSLRDFILRESWADAVRRNTSLLDAHSRLQDPQRPAMEDAGGCETVSQSGVWRISAATIGPPPR